MARKLIGAGMGPRKGFGEALALVAVVALALALRLHDLGALSLWADEALSWQFAQLDLATLWTTPFDVHPPLYYTLLAAAMQFGDSEAALRWPSVIAGTAAIPVIFALGRRIAGPVAGLTAAAVVATSQAHIHYSQEARGYALQFLAVAVATLGVVAILEAALREARARDAGSGAAGPAWAYLAYGGGALAALYTHNISLYFVALANLVVLGHCAADRRCARRLLWRWVGVNLAVLALWAPYGVTLLRLLQAGGDFAWLRHASFAEAAATLGELYGQDASHPFQPALDVFSIGVAVIGVALALRFARAGALVFVLAVVAPFAIWITGFVKPVFMLRTILWTFAAGSLGYGVAAASLRSRPVAIALAAVLIALNLLTDARYFALREKQDWRSVARAVETDSAESAIVLCRKYMRVPIAYYLRDRAIAAPVYSWDGPGTPLFAWREGRWRRAELAELIAPARRLDAALLVSAPACRDAAAEIAAALREAGWAERDRRGLSGRIELRRYEALRRPS